MKSRLNFIFYLDVVPSYTSLCLVVMYTIKSCFKFTWFDNNNYYTCSFVKNSLESSGLQPL